MTWNHVSNLLEQFGTFASIVSGFFIVVSPLIWWGVKSKVRKDIVEPAIRELTYTKGQLHEIFVTHDAQKNVIDSLEKNLVLQFKHLDQSISDLKDILMRVISNHRD